MYYLLILNILSQKINTTRPHNIMKKNLHFIIIHSLITASTCTAMEQKLDFKQLNLFEKSKILSEITIIQEPWQAEYLAEDRMLVNSKDGCCIINPQTNKKIKKIDIQASNFAIHPLKKKIAFSGINAAIYNNSGDLENLIKPEQPLPITSLMFSLLDNSILLESNKQNGYALYQSKAYNYETGEKMNMGTQKISRVAFHPTEKFFYVCYPSGGWHSQPMIEKYSLITLEQTGGIKLPTNCNPTHILCSSNGSLLAVKDSNKTVHIIKYSHKNTHYQINYFELPTIKTQQFIMNPITDTLTAIQQDVHTDTWTDMQFHPNSAVLATVMPLHIDREPHQIVCYWDVQTQQLITTTPPLPTSRRHYTNNIAFSPDGKKLVMILPDKCIILPVPFEVLYDTTNQLRHLYWFLLKENCDQHNTPSDVQNLIMINLLEVKFKR
jgi:WD40 repeat protein